MPARTTWRSSALWWSRRARGDGMGALPPCGGRKSLRRERGRFDDLVLLMLDVAGFGALLAIGNPIRIDFERRSLFFAIGLALVAPHQHHLIESADIGRENPQRFAQMPDMDRVAVRLIELQPSIEAPRNHRISPEIDDHRILPPSVLGRRPAGPRRERADEMGPVGHLDLRQRLRVEHSVLW